MSQLYAREYGEILVILPQNEELRTAITSLIAREPIAGKILEGAGRAERFRPVLQALVNGDLTVSQAYCQTEIDLTPARSRHGPDRRVFPQDWAERLVRTQLNRFYNQAVLEELLAQRAPLCYVPHSSAEGWGSPCTTYLAGRTHDPHILHTRLVQAYAQGQWHNGPKIPDHPHCTHVVVPVQYSAS